MGAKTSLLRSLKSQRGMDSPKSKKLSRAQKAKKREKRRKKKSCFTVSECSRVTLYHLHLLYCLLNYLVVT